MPEAAIVTLLQGVVDDLNDETRGWSQQFKAERKYNPKETLEGINKNLVVLVAMGGWTVAPDNRTDWKHTFEIDIGILKLADEKSGDEATGEFDQLMLLVEEISDYYERTLPTIANCSLRGVAFGPQGNGNPYVREHVQRNQFSAIIRLTFSILRDPSA